MRVALLTWDMPPRPTGLGRAANEIARGLRSQGAEVTVFSADRRGVETIEGLRIVGVSPETEGFLAHTREKACRGHLVMPTAFSRAVAADGGSFDVVEATNWYAPGAFVQRTGLPLVVRCSTPAIDGLDPEGDERHRRDLQFAHLLERRTVARADARIFNTGPSAEKMKEVYELGERHGGTTIGLALDGDLIERGAAAPYPKNGPVRFVFIGRAERRKGFDEMLQAFALLCERLDAAPELHLVGLSPGDLADRVSHLSIPERMVDLVHDHGRAADEEIDALMGGAHAVLAPSRFESYGLVYREAAAWGRPCVMCAEDPSASDFVRRVGSGTLAAECSPEAIATAALEALERATELRRNGLAHARSLDRATLGRRTLAVYESVLRQR